MALIRCPHCHKRMSSRMATCPHCDEALIDLSPDEQARLATRRYKKQRFRALNLSYLGLTALVLGAMWWWLVEPSGWVLPPPMPAVGLVIIGAVTYVVARSWMLWLKLRRQATR